MVQTTKNYKPVGHKDLVYFTFISQIRVPEYSLSGRIIDAASAILEHSPAFPVHSFYSFNK